MPECLTAPALDGIDRRAPFSAGWAAPLELVVPVESIGGASIARTDAETITALTTVGQASALITTTIENGAFRQVHSDDTIEIRLDAEDLTLRGFSIHAAASAARTMWATTWGYTDDPGTEIIRLDVTVDGQTTPPPQRPAVELSDGGFDDQPVNIQGLASAMPDGFGPHRSGVLQVPGMPDTEVSGWADGRAWITVRSQVHDRTEAPPGATSLEVDGNIVVADEAAHEATILTGNHRIIVSGTLPLDDLVAVAAHLPYVGVSPSSPSTGPEISTIHEGTAAIRVELRPGRLLPPADRGDIIGVALRGTTARFSPTVGELTWIENDTIVALSGSTDLATLQAAAEQVVVP